MAYAHQTENSQIGLFFAQARRFGNDAFLRAKLRNGEPCRQWVDITWNKMAEQVRHMGAGLINLGIEKNDCVGIFAHNRPRWIVSDLAVQGAGGICVPIYPTSTDKQLAFILNDCKAKTVIAGDRELLKQVIKVKPDVPSLEFIGCMAPLNELKGENIFDYDELLKKGAESTDARDGFEKRRNELTLNDIASIIYTSGTTGDPKGVMLDQSNLKAQTEILLSTSVAAKLLERGVRLTSLLHLPLCHVMGRTSDYHAQMALGTTIYFAESIQKVQENLLEIKPQILTSIPRLYEKLHEAVVRNARELRGFKKKIFDWGMKTGDLASDYMIKGEVMPFPLALKFALANVLVFDQIRKLSGFDRLVMASSGGGALSKDIAKFFRCMNMILTEGYGLTETTSAITWNGPNFFEPLPDKWIYRKSFDWLVDTMVLLQGSGNTPFKSLTGLAKMTAVSRFILPNLIIKPGFVGRPCKDTEIKIAEDGEVLAKGPQIFKKENGYFNKGEDTKEVFTKDGFFMTGDIGKFDEDGFLKITDRKKELIVTSGGKNIAPHPIELALTFDRYIDQACVVGDGRKFISALLIPQFELLQVLSKEKSINGTEINELIKHPEIIRFFEKRVEKINEKFARYEQIKKIKLLPSEFSEETGELTPTLKMKRRIIHDKYKDEIASLYL